VDSVRTGGPEALPLRVVLWKTICRLSGRTVPKCDRLPTHEPTVKGWYLGSDPHGNVTLFTVDEAIEYHLGWIYLGSEPSLESVCSALAWTYLWSIGRVSEVTYRAALMNGMAGWHILRTGERYDAILFENRAGRLDLAIAEPDGFWSCEGWEVRPEPGMVAIPIELFAREE